MQGDVLLICPPFEGIDRPSLGLHIIQAIARNNGFVCNVFYANLRLAGLIGEDKYLAIAYGPPLDLLGERLFSMHAFPNEEFESLDTFIRKSTLRSSQERSVLPNISAELRWIEQQIGEWLQDFRRLVQKSDYRVYGFTTMFAQNLATSCLTRIVREEKPNAIIIVGGANCEGEMADGITQLCPDVDYVFSGESELSFSKFCRDLNNGKLPSHRVVSGEPNTAWQSLPLPDYSEYFLQLGQEIPQSALAQTSQTFIPYETSRGCWWGQKNHCTFCGLNANGMEFRTKNSAQVLTDLREIARRHPKVRVGMTDNIMPLSYFRDLLPKLASEPTKLNIFYEQKSNLKRHQLIALKSAGINSIQPGIEALSTSLLKRMHKGVSAAQNLAVLRDCRSLNIDPIWNLLYGFPGDSSHDYIETINLIPYLNHLPPPNGCSEVSFDRFSPYFDRHAEFGIKNLRPHSNYARVYPRRLDPVEKYAYHFTGDVDSVRNDSDLLEKLNALVKKWVMAWRSEARPILCVVEAKDGFLVIDSRMEGATELHPVDIETAKLITTSTPQSAVIPTEALQRRWVVLVDGQNVGLASTTSEHLFSLGVTQVGDPIPIFPNTVEIHKTEI